MQTRLVVRDPERYNALQERIDHDFTYHAGSEITIPVHEQVRETLHAAAVVLADLLPDCRELALAITNLEQTHHWAHAAVARNTHAYERKPEADLYPDEDQ